MTQFFKTHKIIFWALVIVLFGIAIWGTALLHQKKIAKEITAQPPVITPTQQPAGASAWQTYRNEELGFEIQIPQRWAKEYKIEETHKAIMEAPPVGWQGFWEEHKIKVFGSVSFSKKVEWVNRVGDRAFSDHMVLGIVVATPEWLKMEEDLPTDRPSVLKITNNKAYIYRKSQDGDKTEADEISKVLSTFKLIP